MTAQPTGGRSKKIAIIQSNYIPWKGYFDIINMVDEFIVYDDAQFTKNSWRNRNRIKTPKGPVWLTIPVATGGRFGQAIDEVEIADRSWAEKHWRSWQTHYAMAPFFTSFAPKVEALYAAAAKEERLSLVNMTFLKGLGGLLGVDTSLTWSRDYTVNGSKTDRVIALCQAAGATAYVSGPAAQDYIEAEKFTAAGIDLIYMDYSGYPEYPQVHPPFDHAVSVIDLLFSVGEKATTLMKSFGAADRP
ncbi:MAG TPA: WbqC family protein [Terriglobales bacterium]|nr:WbqC family protein [Terriglobales bacterium]